MFSPRLYMRIAIIAIRIIITFLLKLFFNCYIQCCNYVSGFSCILFHIKNNRIFWQYFCENPQYGRGIWWMWQPHLQILHRTGRLFHKGQFIFLYSTGNIQPEKNINCSHSKMGPYNVQFVLECSENKIRLWDAIRYAIGSYVGPAVSFL